MKEWAKFNLNYRVKAKLNERGRMAYEKFYGRYAELGCPGRKLEVDGEGYSEFQMHEFVNIFGGEFGPAAQDTPCGMEVLIETESMKELETAKKMIKDLCETVRALTNPNVQLTDPGNYLSRFERFLEGQNGQ